MAESKKAWVTPELIVLVRSKPEEAVLAYCKLGYAPDTGYNDAYLKCERSCFTNCTGAEQSYPLNPWLLGGVQGSAVKR